MAMSEVFAPVYRQAERARAGVGLIPAAQPPISRREAPDFSRVRGRLACPEIDCLRHLLPPATLAAAELRAAEIGVGADRALIAAGDISEDAYALALAQWLGVAFEPLDKRRRMDCPLDDDRLITAGAVGLLPLILNGQHFLVVAPRDARRLMWFLASPSGLVSRLHITTPARLASFIARHGAAAIGHRAAHALKIATPDLSAGANHPRRWLAAFCAAATLAAFALAAPNFVSIALDVALALIFLGWTGLRLIGTLTRHPPHQARERVRDAELPIYTLIVALYREAPTVAGLIKALAALDYPGIRAQTPQAPPLSAGAPAGFSGICGISACRRRHRARRPRPSGICNCGRMATDSRRFPCGRVRHRRPGYCKPLRHDAGERVYHFRAAWRYGAGAARVAGLRGVAVVDADLLAVAVDRGLAGAAAIDSGWRAAHAAMLRHSARHQRISARVGSGILRPPFD
jgi:hypothetical protein